MSYATSERGALFGAISQLERHEVIRVGIADGIQSAIRLYPDAFLTTSVLACEGASEVGLMRGLDQFRTAKGKDSISACGVALVDCGGGDADRCFNRGAAFRALGYRTAILRDDDIEPTISVVDPMQAIFGFGVDDLPKWEEDVCKLFPLAGELSTPWRWINAGAEALGEWVLHVRKDLLRGQPIDVRQAPTEVKWIELNGTDDRKKQLAAASANAPGQTGSVLIIGDSKSPDSQRQFASQIPGAVTIETVDLRDVPLPRHHVNGYGEREDA